MKYLEIAGALIGVLLAIILLTAIISSLPPYEAYLQQCYETSDGKLFAIVVIDDYPETIPITSAQFDKYGDGNGHFVKISGKYFNPQIVDE